jgi:hypothetical protein
LINTTASDVARKQEMSYDSVLGAISATKSGRSSPHT